MEFPEQANWPKAVYLPIEDMRHFVMPLLQPAGVDFSKLPYLPDSGAVDYYLAGLPQNTYEVNSYTGKVEPLFTQNPVATKRLLRIHSHLVQQRDLVSPAWGMLVSPSLYEKFGLSSIDIAPKARILASVADWRGGMTRSCEQKWHTEVQERMRRMRENWEQLGEWFGIPTIRYRDTRCSWGSVEARGENEYGVVVVAEGMTEHGQLLRWQTGDSCDLNPGESGLYTFTVKAHVYDRDDGRRVTLVTRLEKQ